VPVFVVVNHFPCGVAAIRSRIIGVRESFGFAATHLAALVFGST
jgi:hypothetical protein